MKIVIDLDEIILNDITLEQYYLLTLIHFKRLDLLIQYTDKYGEFKVSDIELLKRKELVDFVEFKGDITSVSITEKGNSIIHKYEEVVKTKKVLIEDSSDTDAFCEEQYNKFPEKVKTGGYLVRSGLTAFKLKLKKFMTVNKTYTKETISKAFDLYINEKRRTSWSYMKTASYFVSKDNESVLASYCESALTVNVQPTEQYGSTFR